MKLYADEKERDGLRPRTLHGIGWTLGLFSKATDNPQVHEVTAAQVEAFLRGLRAKNGKDKATRRSWEIHRGALHGFFDWAATPDAASNRPFTFSNPSRASASSLPGRSAKSRTPNPPLLPRRMSGACSQCSCAGAAGCWSTAIRLSLFTSPGLRPDELEGKEGLTEELKRLTSREPELVNLKTRTITIPANVSKTRHERQVAISDNLTAWLKAFPGDLIPTNFEALNKKVRKHFELTHDEARHSFISYHVALHRSIGDAALQAGNSEAIVKRHYLNTHTREEGGEFFRIIPGKRRAELAKPKKAQPPHLRAV